MKKCLLRKLIAISLSTIMLVITPVTVFAKAESKTTKEYISELRVASNKNADAAKKELTDKGYTVIDSNVNGGTGKDFVYIGYKTTTNSAEAITDIRVMDMKGGFSASEYETALKQQEEQVSKQLNEFKESIKEFHDLYKDNDEKAVYVHKELNKFKEDDSGKLVGDLFVADDLDMNTLTKIFVQGNGEIIQAIESLFAILFSDDWLALAAENTGNKYSSSSNLDSACADILSCWEGLQNGLYRYYIQMDDDEGYNMSKYTEESFNAWYNKNEKNQNNSSEVLMYGTMYELLSKYETADGGKLIEVFLKNKDDVTYEDLYPIADALAGGALQAMKYVGLTFTVTCNNLDVNKLDESNNNNKTLIEEMAVECVNKDATTEKEKIKSANSDEVYSVYTGVDRSVFDKNSGIALTSDALRAKAVTQDDSLAKLLGKNMKIASLFICGGVVLFVIGVSIAKYEASKALTAAAASYVTRTYRLMAGFGIGIIVGCVAAAIGIAIDEYYHPEYSAIPRGMVEQLETKVYDKSGKLISSKSEFCLYYAAFDTEDPGSGNRKFGDLNGWSGKQWNALYYTKDVRVGNPITTDILVQVGNSETPSGYTPVRYFGVKGSAFDLNSHTFSSKAGIYMFYRVETDSTFISSSFSYGTLAISAFLGLIVGGFGTYLITKSKKKKSEEIA